MPCLGGIDAALLVLDKDGVLLDFDRRWAEITRARAAALAVLPGHGLPAAAFERLLGLGPDGRATPGGLLASGSRLESATVAAAWLHQSGRSWTRARAEAQAAFTEADAYVDFARSSRALPGVVSGLTALAAMGWKLAVATTDQTEDAGRFLQLAGIQHLFAAVIGVDRVATGKPDPAMFLLACQETGVGPQAAVMVGDLEVDLLMGRAAGAAATVGVLSGVASEAMLAPHANFVVKDLAALAELAASAEVVRS